jgi:hypothetical protein
MNRTEFDKIVDERLKSIKNTLQIKGLEYQRNNDPLHNFNVAARINNVSREKALWGFALKHYVSFIDILNDIDNNILPSTEKVDEKIGDLINYLILCEASIKDKIEKNDKKV